MVGPLRDIQSVKKHLYKLLAVKITPISMLAQETTVSSLMFNHKYRASLSNTNEEVLIFLIVKNTV